MATKQSLPLLGAAATSWPRIDERCCQELRRVAGSARAGANAQFVLGDVAVRDAAGHERLLREHYQVGGIAGVPEKVAQLFGIRLH